MNNSNRCKECGNILDFFLLTDRNGTLRICKNSLTTGVDIPELRKKKGEQKETHMILCNTVHDEHGKVFDGIVSYKVCDGERSAKTETCTIRNGKVR